MTESSLPFHSAAKALSHCELCLHHASNPDVGYTNFEFFYNSFIYYICLTNELIGEELCKIKDKEIIGFFRRIENMTDFNSPSCDPLLSYVRFSRNQLTHNERILWNSSEYNDEEELGEKENLGQHHNVTSAKKYSTNVLPSLSLNFTDIYVAARPVTGKLSKKTKKILVPNSCCGNFFKSTPRNIMLYSYEFYGQNFAKIVDWHRKIQQRA